MRSVLRLNPKECNLSCDYCLLKPLKVKNSISGELDLSAIKRTALELDSGINISGGEPLLLPDDCLRELLEFGYENWGEPGLQTNGVLIESKHLKMFKKYEANVFFSVDGPGELNDFRNTGDDRDTEAATEKTIGNIKRLSEAGIEIHVGVLISRANAGSAERLEKLKDFLKWLGNLNVSTIQIKPLYINPVTYVTSAERVGDFKLEPRAEREAFLELADFTEEHPGINIRFFNLCKQMLLGEGVNCCIFKTCDYASTDYSNLIGPRGEVYNCIGSYREGNDPLKSSCNHYQRYVALYHTPRDLGGCEGCRFFVSCLGLCPATALGDDPRNRSKHCELFKALFEYYEKQLLEAGKQPVSKSERLPEIEKEMIEALRKGNKVSITEYYQGGNTCQ